MNTVKLVNGNLEVYRGDGSLIQRIGLQPNGQHGIWIAKTKERIFDMDIVLRYKYFSKEEINITMMKESKEK